MFIAMPMSDLHTYIHCIPHVYIQYTYICFGARGRVQGPKQTICILHVSCILALKFVFSSYSASCSCFGGSLNP